MSKYDYLDSVIFQRLEVYKTPLPYDFRKKVVSLCNAKGIGQFADLVIFYIEGVKNIRQQSGEELSARDVADMILSAISVIIEKNVPESNVIAAKQVSPELLKAIISNQKAYDDTLAFFVQVIDKIGKP